MKTNIKVLHTNTHAVTAKNLLEPCTAEAIALLKRNLTPAGLMAATRTAAAEERRYTRIFGRDVGISILGMVLSGDTTLAHGAVAGLTTLAQHQAENGQIPKYVDPEQSDADFWYVGCIDATLWWLIGLHFADVHVQDIDLRRTFAPQIAKAIHWLNCQEHPRLRLLQQNEASDWADIMPRSGFVLYTNALWYYVKKLYALPHREATHFHFNHLFHPFSKELAEYRRLRLLTDYVRGHGNDNDLYLSFVNFSFWGEEGDTFGNVLAVLFGLADDAMTQRILNALTRMAADQPLPVRSVCQPIHRESPLWREYMQRHEQNYEYQYHNGGAWPFIGAFWAVALAANGRREQATDALARVALANSYNDWEFNEWLHGRSGEPRGMPGQSWNAAMFIAARKALTQEIF